MTPLLFVWLALGSTDASVNVFCDDMLSPDGGVCMGCSPGSYLPPASTVCMSCPPGSSSEGGIASSCTACLAGTFAPDSGSSVCQRCPGGQYSEPEASACQPCSAGRWSDAGASICNPCNAGTFAPDAGFATCLTCEPGTVAPDQGSATCSACSGGQYSEPTHQICKACRAGTFSTAPGDLCTPCPKGSISASSGALECKVCGLGTYSLTLGGTVCLECGTCNDQNPCTLDLCLATKGCSHAPDRTVCPDAGFPDGGGPATPVITTEPLVTALCGRPYRYSTNSEAALTASDSEILWSLDKSPDGFYIDPRTGVVSWHPSIDQKGNHPVILRATGEGGTTTQSFEVDVGCPDLVFKTQACSACSSSGTLPAALLLSAWAVRALRPRRRADK